MIEEKAMHGAIATVDKGASKAIDWIRSTTAQSCSKKRTVKSFDSLFASIAAS